eukprot:1153086-Pelagomonas_calceolata.AAC.1
MLASVQPHHPPTHHITADGLVPQAGWLEGQAQGTLCAGVHWRVLTVFASCKFDDGEADKPSYECRHEIRASGANGTLLSGIKGACSDSMMPPESQTISHGPF